MDKTEHDSNRTQTDAAAAPTPDEAEDRRRANRSLIERYLQVATPGNLEPDRIRAFLADDVEVDDPLMSVSGADAFIDVLRQVPASPDMGATVQDIVAGTELVAARVLFTAGPMTVQFAQWFWVDEDKITRIEVVYDTRPFLESDT